MNDIIDLVNDKESFQQMVKDTMDQVALGALEDMKREIANDFLTNTESGE